LVGDPRHLRRAACAPLFHVRPSKRAKDFPIPLAGPGSNLKTSAPPFTMNHKTLLTRRAFTRHLTNALALATLTALPKTNSAESADSPVRHRFLCCDYQGGKVAIVAADGSIEWEFPAKTPQDCWLLPNGNILFCHATGTKEVSPDKTVVWEYASPAQCHSCQPLPNGRVLVAECGLNRIVEVRRSDRSSVGDGQVSKEIKIDSKPKNISHQFRGTRQTADLHYWVCLMDEQKIVELDPAGQLLRTIKVDGYPHAALKLPNGHLLITLGEAAQVIELDQNEKIIWRLDQNEARGNPLRLPAGCQRLPNGNTIICNYLPGPFMGKQPQAFEITPHKQVIWEFADHTHFKTINQIQLLDPKTAPLLR
jgi:hypothetical protein